MIENKYSLKDIAIKLEFYSKNKKPHTKLINTILKNSNIKGELIQTKKRNGNTFFKIFYNDDALNYIKNECKGKNIKSGVNQIEFNYQIYILVYGKNSKYKRNNELNLCSNCTHKKTRFILESQKQFFKGGFYYIEGSLYPQASGIAKFAKKYKTKEKASKAKEIIFKNTSQRFKIINYGGF